MSSTPHLAIVRGLVRAIRNERRSGRPPKAIILGPHLAQGLKARAFAYLWSDREQTELLGFPVTVDPDAVGWSLVASADSSPLGSSGS